MKNNKYEIDMVNGSIMDKLISFALPLMISGILQLAFNAVDIIVVGQFSGSKSLAAVGSTTALINVFVNLFMGISLGANVLAARFYAAGKEKEMSKTVHTSIMIALISGIVMGVVGVIFARGALEIMGTPDDVIGLSAIYMRIYFCGMPFFMLYNYGAAILRAVGDTKRPLIFLIISGCINALLNLFFVIVCKLDVAGAVGVGFMNVIKDMGLKEPYVGQVALQTSEIAEDLTYYFATSEQVPSAVGLGVLMNKDNTVRQAGGFIVQLMPFAEESTIAKLEENVQKITSVTNLLEEGHTPESLLEKVLEGFDMEINDKVPTEFYCNCSRERVEKALISIGRKELNEMIQEGKSIEMNCHFCNKNYEFTVEELKEILRKCK